MKILGLDLALNCTGWVAVNVDEETSDISVERIGNTNTTGNKDWGEKYEIIFEQMKYLNETIKPDVLVIERPFMKHGKSTMAIMGALGIVRLVFKNIEPILVSPNSIKLAIAGHGHAKKDLVQLELSKMFPELMFGTEDESDALGAVITHLMRENIFSSDERVVYE